MFISASRRVARPVAIAATVPLSRIGANLAAAAARPSTQVELLASATPSFLDAKRTFFSTASTHSTSEAPVDVRHHELLCR